MWPIDGHLTLIGWSMYSTSTLIGLSLVLVLTQFLSYVWANHGLPPFPSIPLPVIGHLHIMDPKFSRANTEKWREQLGDVYSFKAGPKLMVIINGYKTIKEAFVHKAEAFSGRPFVYINEGNGADSKGCPLYGIAWNDGPAWHEQRSASVAILKKMGMGKNILAEIITEECVSYLKELSKANGQPQDIYSLTQVSVTNVVCSVIVGQRFEYNDVTFKRMLSAMEYILDNVSTPGIAILNIWPILGKIPGDIFGAKHYLKVDEEFKQLFCQYFTKLKGKTEYDEQNMDSFIAHYVREISDRERRGETTVLSEETLTINIADFVSAARASTADILIWFVMFMLHYPDVQDKIFQEINTHVGTERAPIMADRINLNYVNAAIQETVRLGNHGPIGIPHRATEDTSLKGFRIPKGATVIASFTSMNFDKSVWGEDVDTFRPERFLEASGSVKNFEEHIPFSTGKRACPGEAFGKMELFLYVTFMCQRYKFLPAVQGKPPTMEDMGGITRRPKPFQVRTVDRRLM